MNEGNSARGSEINCLGDKKSPSLSELLAIAHVLSQLVILGPIRTSCRYWNIIFLIYFFQAKSNYYQFTSPSTPTLHLAYHYVGPQMFVLIIFWLVIRIGKIFYFLVFFFLHFTNFEIFTCNKICPFSGTVWWIFVIIYKCVNCHHNLDRAVSLCRNVSFFCCQLNAAESPWEHRLPDTSPSFLGKHLGGV